MTKGAEMAVTDLIEYGRDLLGVVGERERGALADRIAVRPVRSALYVPGNRRDWLRKAPRHGADAILIDLEDSVPPAERDAARAIVSEEIGPLSEQVGAVWVRLNSESDEVLDDLAAATVPGLAAVQLPKVFDPDAIVELDRALGYYEGRNGLPFGTIAIIPILETASGIRRAFDIAMCSRRVEYLGALVAPDGDTARALNLRAMSDPAGTESLHLRSKVLLDSRAAGVTNPLGGVVTDLRPDSPVLEAFARMNRDLGYSGMIVIHPSHVPVVNAVYSPSAEEIRRARQVLEALHASADRGAIRGPGDGEMIDYAMGRVAVLTLQSAAAFGLDVDG